MKVLRFIAAASLALVGAVAAAQSQERTTPVPPQFFGLVIHRAHTTTAWPDVPFGTWRIWDSYLKWSDLEPEPGRWRFDVFDKQVELGQSHGKELIYTFGQVPRWASTAPDEKHPWGMGAGAMPRNPDDWKRYVEAVVTRYKGRIAGYEVGNEPKYPEASGRCRGAIFFCGAPRDLVALTQIAHDAIKRIDPAAKLATPGFTDGVRGVQRLDEYLAAGAAPLVDAISFHFYDAVPEQGWETLRALRRVMQTHRLSALPIWNSEVGFLIQNQEGDVAKLFDAGPLSLVLSPEAGAARLARVFLVSASGGVDRVIWYAWDNKRMGAIGTRDGRPTAVAAGYRTVQRWLVGATLSCGPGRGVDWECQLRRGGRTARVLWSRELGAPKPLRTVVADARWVEPLLEASQSGNAAAEYAWNGSPVLVSDDGKAWTNP